MTGRYLSNLNRALETLRDKRLQHEKLANVLRGVKNYLVTHCAACKDCVKSRDCPAWVLLQIIQGKLYCACGWCHELVEEADLQERE